MTGAGNWTWFIDGQAPTLIDAGVGDPGHLEAIDDAVRRDLAHVLVTHAHGDHASGAPMITERMPSARFHKYPWPEYDGRSGVAWEAVADGDELDAGDTRLVAVHTPGHAPDHLCFWHPESGVVFCGDLVVSGSTVWVPANQRGDMAAYIASLRTVLSLNPRRLFPAHGPVIDDPQTLLRRYIDHRLEREAQVVGALREGDQTAAAMVARIYQGLQEILIPRAEETVTAHLHKLEREGLARSSEIGRASCRERV